MNAFYFLVLYKIGYENERPCHAILPLLAFDKVGGVYKQPTAACMGYTVLRH